MLCSLSGNMFHCLIISCCEFHLLCLCYAVLCTCVWHVRAKRLGNCEHVNFADIMGTVAAIKSQLQKQKLLAEKTPTTVADLIANKYICYCVHVMSVVMFKYVVMVVVLCFCFCSVGSGQRGDCKNFATCTSMDGRTSIVW